MMAIGDDGGQAVHGRPPSPAKAGRWRRFVGSRPPIERDPSTADFTAEVLDSLRTAGYSPAAWWRFWVRSWERSCEVARGRPRAAREVHALHALLLVATRDPRVALSWAMAWTHLGMLPREGGLGPANVMTLLRANLPLLAPRHARTAALAAVVTDYADGWVARHRREETAFGAYADGLADAVFWTWFAARFERQRTLKQLAIAFWGVPPLALFAAAFGAGRLVVPPRLLAIRAASALLQATLTWRAFTTLRRDVRG